MKEKIDTVDGAKPRFLNRGKKRRSVSTLSIPRASDRGVEWVDFQGFCFNILDPTNVMRVPGSVHAKQGEGYLSGLS